MVELSFDRVLFSHSPAETETLAGELYRLTRGAGVIALYGPLGSGKTCFVRGIAKAAGIDPRDVNSPSFTLINEYPGGETPIFHFDLYRLTDPSQFYSIGGDDYLVRDGLMLIEWAENGAGFIPENRIDIDFDIVDQTTRRIIISRSGR